MNGAICFQCGGPRSSTSGSRCKACYTKNVRARKDRRFRKHECAIADLLEAERASELLCTPGGWCMPEHLEPDEIALSPWYAHQHAYWTNAAKSPLAAFDDERDTSGEDV